MYVGSSDVADGVEVGVRVAMALGWERLHGEVVEAMASGEHLTRTHG